MRTLLFTGTGGAGTSTLATAAALRSARAGARTVLLCRRPPAVAGLDAVPGLGVAVADGQEALETLWRDRADEVEAALPALALPPASSVVPLPGTAELALLAALGRMAGDVVVVDAGPLDRAVALLALPGTLRWWLDQALPPRVRALGAVRTAAVRSGAVRRGPVDAALAALPALEGLLGRVALADPVHTAVTVVATADRNAAAAAREAATVLGLHGQRTASVLARVLPGDGAAGEWWAQRLAAQAAALAQLAEIGPVVPVPERAVPPAGVEEVAALLRDGDLPIPAAVAAEEPERLDGGWRLNLPLPFAERSAVELTRCGDDLVVTAAGSRRSLRLNSLLRRCRVTGGRLAAPGTPAARLEVTFVPDPALWPADLMGPGTAPAAELPS